MNFKRCCLPGEQRILKSSKSFCFESNFSDKTKYFQRTNSVLNFQFYSRSHNTRNDVFSWSPSWKNYWSIHSSKGKKLSSLKCSENCSRLGSNSEFISIFSLSLIDRWPPQWPICDAEPSSFSLINFQHAIAPWCLNWVFLASFRSLGSSRWILKRFAVRTRKSICWHCEEKMLPTVKQIDCLDTWMSSQASILITSREEESVVAEFILC